MRIRLIGEISGTRDGQPWPPRGSTITLPDDEATELCRQGMARPVADEPVVEVAVIVDDPTVEARSGLTADTGSGRRGRTARP